MWFKNLSIFILCLSKFTLAQNYLRSDSLLTCMENSQFTTTYFDVTYYPSNNSVVFDIDAVSTISTYIKAVANIVIYGINVDTFTLQACSLGYSSLCPMTAGRLYIGGETYTLTNNDVSKNIPNIGYTVPDLDAYVQVVVYDRSDTNNTTPLACVKAILTNGKTVQTRYAGWPIAVVAGLGLVISSFVSILGHSATAAHIASNAASLFIYFQNLALTSMLGVSKVPPIAASWAQNFQWTMGIIKTEFMQDMIYWYVQSTGGTVTSVLANKSIYSIAVQRFLNKMARLVKRSTLDDVLDDTSLYTTDESNISSKTLVLRGIQRVAYLADIEISNVFMTSIIFFLFIGFVLLVLLMFFKAICEILARTKVIHPNKLIGFRNNWASIIKGSLYRLFSITFPQLTFICIWEFTRNDSPGCLVFAIVILAVTWVLMLFALGRIMWAGLRSVKDFKNPAYLLYGNPKILNKLGFLYSQYKASHFFWVGIYLGYMLVRSLVIAVLQTHGQVAACIVFAFDVIYCVLTIIFRPYMDKRTNVFNIFIAVINVINAIFYMFFSNVFSAKAAISSIAALVYFIMNAIFAFILLVFTIITCALALIRRNPDTRYQPIKDDRGSFIPKEGEEIAQDKTDVELAALGATAMRGHDRDSMFIDSKANPFSNANAINNNDSEVPLSTSMKETSSSSKNNPFDVEYNDDDESSIYFKNNNGGSNTNVASNNNYRNNSLATNASENVQPSSAVYGFGRR